MRKVTLYIALLLFLGSTADLQAQKQTPPAGGKAKDFKLPAKKEQKYTNGLKTVLVPYGSVPKVNVSLIIKTGNVHEAADQVWLADLTGRMMKEGTATLKFADISKKAALM
ncbi:MAG TPA: insulinase family protein, partial [Verrucomicrobiae bacterium]|nr:insulinase family protein [Verrucomicrobiae bacterium]